MPERVLSSVLIVLRKCFPCNDVESFPHLVELLDEYLDTFSTQWTVARACNSGLSRRALEYLAERDPDWENGTNVAGNAVQEGFIHVLQWLNDCYPERTLWEWTQVCFSELAVGAQQFAVLKWLHANRNEECTTRAIDEAARIGRLDMIEWLHENRSVGCTTKAMVYAARDGYLDVVKWLHIHHGEKCTKEAMDEAARFGHLEVVKWLHTNCSEGCTTYAMDDAAAYGYLDVVRFLHENRNEGCSSTAMTNAAEKNHLDIVRYLYANRSENDLGEALSASVRCDQCAVVEYLSAIVHQKEGVTQLYLEQPGLLVQMKCITCFGVNSSIENNVIINSLFSRYYTRLQYSIANSSDLRYQFFGLAIPKGVVPPRRRRRVELGDALS